MLDSAPPLNRQNTLPWERDGGPPTDFSDGIGRAKEGSKEVSKEEGFSAEPVPVHVSQASVAQEEMGMGVEKHLTSCDFDMPGSWSDECAVNLEPSPSMEWAPLPGERDGRAGGTEEEAELEQARIAFGVYDDHIIEDIRATISPKSKNIAKGFVKPQKKSSLMPDVAVANPEDSLVKTMRGETMPDLPISDPKGPLSRIQTSFDQPVEDSSGLISPRLKNIAKGFVKPQKKSSLMLDVAVANPEDSLVKTMRGETMPDLPPISDPANPPPTDWNFGELPQFDFQSLEENTGAAGFDDGFWQGVMADEVPQYDFQTPQVPSGTDVQTPNPFSTDRRLLID